MFSGFILVKYYLELIKKPAKIKRGIITGTTNAEAASGDGIATPITEPR